MANARWGGAPHSLKAFTSQLFHLRYSVRSVALRQLRDLGHNVRRYRHLLPVAKFGLSCGLLGEEEVSGELRTVTEFPRVGGEWGCGCVGVWGCGCGCGCKSGGVHGAGQALFSLKRILYHLCSSKPTQCHSLTHLPNKHVHPHATPPLPTLP